MLTHRYSIAIEITNTQQQWILVKVWTLQHSFTDRGGAHETLLLLAEGFRGKARGITEGKGVNISTMHGIHTHTPALKYVTSQVLLMVLLRK